MHDYEISIRRISFHSPNISWLYGSFYAIGDPYKCG